ncbi:MAG: glycosyltransferase family 9 protein [Candidatus Krumholzibacteria bacterium]|nr:glycosyltransferase family 9 protein [Candidatus Krumholzibacteria bacterium]MDH4336380.1 glycosyltransferase family 9 protein [Candidatus Krumholzibacteria bacterium]MDH5269505.1 glycosyltransferase family 9 protein [Candidatus Krumholzibacteria bacterium]MDH5628133.1 glycosyltransferase family 9 protein [Candidatus Krumholzibacteria bacterium]
MKPPRDRILVTRLNFLGDVVLSLPLVDALRDACPGAEIDYLTRRPGTELLAGDTRFAAVFEQRPGVLAALRLVRALRARRYRAVIDLYSNPRSAWLTWSTGAPLRVGGDRRGRRHLYTHPVSVPQSIRRVTDIFMQYGAPLGVTGSATLPSLSIRADERARADHTLERRGAVRRPLVGVHPGGKWSVKRWPTAGFVELIRTLSAQLGAEVIVFTGPGEVAATEAVRAEIGDEARYAPPMAVRELAAMLSRLDAMVACDGGVMHVSAAVGTPTVGVFGSSEPSVWFPYAGHGPYRAAFIDVPCRPCHRHECPLGHTRCLNDLSAAAVLAQVRDVLAWKRSGASA